MADLGTRLLEAGLITRAQLARARAQAPPHGGALVDRLVTLGVDEAAIAGFFLSEGYGPLLEAEDLAGADAAALGRLSARAAEQLLALPVREAAGALLVAMADPSDGHAVEEVRHALGLRVVPTVARLGDLRRALGRVRPAASAGRVPRGAGGRRPELDETPSVIVSLDELGPDSGELETPIDLVRRRDRDPSPARYGGPTRGEARSAAKGAHRPAPPSGEDSVAVPLVQTKVGAGAARPGPALVSKVANEAREDGAWRRRQTRDFERTPTADYALDGEEPAVLPEVPEVHEVPEVPEVPEAAALAVTEAARGRARSPVPEAAAPAAGDGALDDRWGDLSTSSAPPAPPRPLRPPPGKLPRRARAALLGPRPPSRPPGELGPILAGLRAARTRDDVVRLACEGAMAAGRAAVFLALRRGTLVGWLALGAGLSRDATRNLLIPTTSPSIFQAVVDERLPYGGPHGETAADVLFRAAVGSRGGDVLLVPVVVSGKTAGVLCVDDLRYGDRGRERVEVIAHAVAEAFQRIIVSGRTLT